MRRTKLCYGISTIIVLLMTLTACRQQPDFSDQASKELIAEVKRIRRSSPKMENNQSSASVLDTLRSSKQEQPKKVNLYNIAANNVPAKKFFYTLSQQTNTNMIIDESIEGMVTFELKQVSLENILELLSTVHGYYFKKVGTALYVSPQRLETKIYNIRGLALKRKGATAMNVGGGNESTAEGSSSTSSASLETSFDIENIWTDIKQTIQAIIGKQYTPPALENDFAYRPDS